MERTKKAILIGLMAAPFYYLCWPIGVIVGAAKIGFLAGRDKLVRGPKLTDKEIKREIM